MSATALRHWIEANRGGFGGDLLFDEPLARHTYYRIGGPAAAIAIPRGLDDLRWLSRAAAETATPVLVLGSGSNVLAPDEGVSALIVKTTQVDAGVSRVDAPEGSLRIRTGASVTVTSLLRHASQEGWGGLEFLAGIPGSIGGVVRMNGGTHLGEASSRIRAVESFSLDPLREKEGRLTRTEGEALRFEYRRCLFLGAQDVVVVVEWEVSPGDPAVIKASIDSTLARRKQTQPLNAPSCGSVFKNPIEHGLRAWEVVERLGLKGHRIGNAAFSEKHANWIVNLGGARASDVSQLIQLAKSRARAELGIELHEEVVYFTTS